MLLPCRGTALHQSTQLAANQGQVDGGIHAHLRGKDDPVGVLAVHNQLCGYQVDLPTQTIMYQERDLGLASLSLSCTIAVQVVVGWADAAQMQYCVVEF